MRPLKLTRRWRNRKARGESHTDVAALARVRIAGGLATLNLHDPRDLASFLKISARPAAERETALRVLEDLAFYVDPHLARTLVPSLAQNLDKATASELNTIAHIVHILSSDALNCPVLRQLRNEQDIRRRQELTYILRFSRDRRVREPLLRLLRDEAEDERVRGFAAEALGSFVEHRHVQAALVRSLRCSLFIRVSVLCALQRSPEIPEAHREVERLLDDRSAIPGEDPVSEFAQRVLDRWRGEG